MYVYTYIYIYIYTYIHTYIYAAHGAAELLCGNASKALNTAANHSHYEHTMWRWAQFSLYDNNGFTLKLYCGSLSSVYPPSPPAKPTRLQYFCTTISCTGQGAIRWCGLWGKGGEDTGRNTDGIPRGSTSTGRQNCSWRLTWAESTEIFTGESVLLWGGTEEGGTVGRGR